MERKPLSNNEVNARLPSHRRVKRPPPMQLTGRDRQVIQAVYEYRLLRRNQIQTLFFPSQNTTNRRLQHLYQHGFLQRHLPPVRLGEGRPQAIYSLDQRGAEIIVAESGIDRTEIRWRKKDNRASFLFQDHTLRINDFRIALTLAACERGHQIIRWLDEREIKALRERVPTPERRKAHLPVVPDAFCEYETGTRRAGFFLEMDMGTMTVRRFKEKIRAYIIYKTQGHYEKTFGMTSLRVLTVTNSDRRLKNLKHATELAQGQSLFWFTTFDILFAERILQSGWQIAGQVRRAKLFQD